MYVRNFSGAVLYTKCLRSNRPNITRFLTKSFGRNHDWFELKQLRVNVPLILVYEELLGQQKNLVGNVKSKTIFSGATYGYSYEKYISHPILRSQTAKYSAREYSRRLKLVILKTDIRSVNASKMFIHCFKAQVKIFSTTICYNQLRFDTITI